MKYKNPFRRQPQSQNNDKDERRAVAWQRILPRLVAVFLIIVFLASECAP